MSTPSRALTGALVIALAGVAGYLAYGFAQRSREEVRPITPAESAKQQQTAESLDDDQHAPKRKIPEKLPDFALADLQGQPRKLSEWGDRPLLVNFWATWCEPCRREIPLLKKLRHQHSDQRLEIVGIAVDFREAVLKYASEIGIDYPLLIGEQDGLDAIQAFGMEPVFPFSVFADRRSRIVAIRVGELHADEADFILAQVREIDAGRLDLPEAKQRIGDKLRDLSVRRATGSGPG